MKFVIAENSTSLSLEEKYRTAVEIRAIFRYKKVCHTDLRYTFIKFGVKKYVFSKKLCDKF